MRDLSLFQEALKEQLGQEYEAYEEAMKQPAVHGLKVNTLKVTAEKLKEILPGMEEAVPWGYDGYYLDPSQHVGSDPYAYAGLFYQQEPSAMLPGAVLPVKANERVLDLCAAPGGKSITIACKLNHTGLLWANDISVSRAQTMLRNLERCGADHAVVSAEKPEKLADALPEVFDAVLVDGPCSGEGMFRKEPALKKDWEEKGPAYYAPLQREILSQAVKMVKPGGCLEYSTCTFSSLEDEENVQWLLHTYPAFHLMPLEQYPGFVDTGHGMKLYPHRIKGEGHFTVLLQKEGEKSENPVLPAVTFTKNGITYAGHGTVRTYGTKTVCNVYENSTDGLRILRNGLLLGETEKGRFTPSQAMAMAGCTCSSVHLDHDDIRIMKYLKGETIDLKDQNVRDGWCLIHVGMWPLGFGMVKKGVCKNKLQRSWIIH